jgi:hypothetical protein
VNRIDMPLQVAGRPERHAIAVGAGMIPAILVHHLDALMCFVRLPFCPKATPGQYWHA